MGYYGKLLGAFGLGEEEELDPTFIGAGNPLADPLLTQASQYAMMQLGIAPDLAMSQQGSPMSIAMSRYSDQGPATEAEIRSMQREMSMMSQMIAAEGDIDINAVYGPDPELIQMLSNRWNAIAGAVGMSMDELFQAQGQYTIQQKEQSAQMQEMASLSQQGQYDAIQQLAALMGDLPDVSASGIDALKGQEKERLLRELNLSADEYSGNALRQANFANYNPGRVLGDIEEARMRGTQDADMMSLEYALGMLGGEQNLSISRGTQLQGYRDAPTQLAAQLAGVRMTGLNAPTQAYYPQMVPGQFTRALGDAQKMVDVGKGVMDIASSAGAMAACWCAAVYYPYFSQDWIDCREWVIGGWRTPAGRAFKRLYLRHGKRASRALEQSTWLRRMVRPLFMWIRKKGAEYRWQMDPR